MSDYEIPPAGTARVQPWLLEALSAGEAWLRSQRPTLDWDRVSDMLAPHEATDIAPDLSRTGFNKGARIARELVASLSNFRYEGQYRPEYDQKLYEQSQILSKRDQSWFRQSLAHKHFREIMQYAVAFGTGYGYQVWDKHYWGSFRGDVRLTALSPEDVLCVQMPRDHDLQRTYAVIIREELPINLAKRIYAQTNRVFADALLPDRDSPGWIDKGLRKVQQLLGGSPIFKYLSRDQRRNTSFPTVDIFHVYTMDDTINTGMDPVTMGALDTNWSYSVPPLGSLLPNGSKADHEAARLYPLRRYSIFARSVPFPAYDGSSPWWHGQVPLARFVFNDWAWESLGQSTVGDVQTMQRGIESIMRDIEDSCHARLDPPLLFDDGKVSKGFAEAVNPRRAGVRAAAALDFGEVLRPVGQQWQYEVPPWIVNWVHEQEARMDYLAATPDLVAVAKARQIPSGDTLEKILEMAGPLVQDMIRGVEWPQYELGEMRKAYYLQFDTRARWISLAGPGTSDADYYYQPDLIVPSGPPGETVEARSNRTRLFLHQFHYHLSQSGVNELHRMTTKLFYLQLMKAGFPISWWTFANIAQIPNFGPEPEGPNGLPVTNELEKWIAQQRILHDLAEDAAKSQMQAQAQVAAQSGIPPKAPPGRPPVNTAPPRIMSKDGGSRSTVVTSQ